MVARPAVPATIEALYLVTIVFADSRVNILLAGVRAIRINGSRVPKANPRIMRARGDLRPSTDTQGLLDLLVITFQSKC